MKARRSPHFGHPKTAVTALKQRKLSMVALHYLKTTGQSSVKARFDVVAISGGTERPEVEVVRNAFELAYDMDGVTPFELIGTVTLSARGQFESVTSRNVVGKVPGGAAPRPGSAPRLRLALSQAATLLRRVVKASFDTPAS